MALEGQTWFGCVGFVPALSLSVSVISVSVHAGVDVRSGEGRVVSAFCLLFPVQLVGRVVLDSLGLLVGGRLGGGVVSVKHPSQGLFLLSGFVTRLATGWGVEAGGVFVAGVPVWEVGVNLT